MGCNFDVKCFISTNWKKFIFFLILMILTVGYTYYVKPITDDELFNYGFATNILKGIVPYRDFNMIIPPLFHYILAFIFKIFGNHLLVYHFVLGVMISAITVLIYKRIGIVSLAIYLVILTYPYTGYNIFCLFLFIILLLRKEDKSSKYLEPILITVMILSKHILGLLVIPSLIYSKNRKKTFLIYVIGALFLFSYLIIFNNLWEFIDYCILGMFDFTNKNGTGFNPFLLLEIIILICLVWDYKKYKEKNTLYVLMFQIMTFPIVNYYHFIFSFVPVLYLLFYKVKNYKNYKLIVHFTLTIAISFFLFFNFVILQKDGSTDFLTHYSKEGFMKGRMVYKVTESYIFFGNEYVKKYSDYDLFILGHFSYLMKLNFDIPINKFDIINNGNMGYNGYQGYIDEIDEHCVKNKCVFIIGEWELESEEGSQTNKELLKYVIKNYNRTVVTNKFGVYIN